MSNCLINDETLRQPIAKLYDAFVDCPSAVGESYDNLGVAMDNLNDFVVLTEKMAQAVGNVDESFLGNVDNLVGIYHDFWSRPFPAGFERGQILGSAIMEQSFRNMLKTFERLEKGDYSPNKPIDINLVPMAESARFEEWAVGLSAVPVPVPVADSYEDKQFTMRHRLSPPSSCSFGSLAVAFLLGWWLDYD